MRQDRAPRIARGAVAASVATFVALLSHVAAGGAMPGMLGIAVPWVLSFAVCVVLAGRSLSLVRLSLAVTVSQVLFHTLFVLGASAAPAASFVPAAAGHAHHGVVVAAGASASGVVDPAMWLGHALAVVLTVAALYRGERAALRLLDLARASIAWVRARLAVVAPLFSTPDSVTTPVVAAWFPRTAPQRAVARRRGPPLLPAL